MSRDFSRNVGNHMDLGTGALGAVLHGKSAIFVHAWINVDTFVSGTDNDILMGVMTLSAVGLRLSCANNLFTVQARSTSADTAQSRTTTTPLTTGIWTSVGAWINYVGDAITPYVNGIADNGGAATFGNNTYNHSLASNPDRIGAIGGATIVTTRQMDGKIAEVSIFNATGWDATKANAVAADLALYGASVVASRNTVTLTNYMKLVGNNSPETSSVGTLVGTITGSLPKATHPMLRDEVATPVIAPNGGSYANTISISLNCASPDSTIYYTTNGTTPTNASTVYFELITLTVSSTVKAIAYVDTFFSSVASAVFEIIVQDTATGEICHADMTKKMIHQMFHFQQATDPALVPANGVIAGHWWLDTSISRLYYRNDTNDGWEIL